MQSWCKTWLLNGSSRIRAKQKLLRKHRRACKSSWSLIGKPKVIYTDNSLELGKAAFNTTQIRNKWDCWESSAQSERRHLCCIVAIGSKWKLVGRFYGMLHLSAKNSRSLVWWGRRPMEDVLGNHLKDRSFFLVHWLSITLFLRKTSQESINLERNAHLDCWICIVRGENLEGWRTGRRPWGVGDDGRIGNLLEKTQCERGDISQRKWKFYFPAADGRINTPGGDQELRTPTLTREHPIRGEGHVDFLGEWEGSLPPPHDSFPDAGEAINDCWSISGNFIYRHHVEPRVKLYSPREESFTIPLKCIDVSRTTHTNLDVKQEKRIDDYWNIDGSRDLSDSWTGFTQTSRRIFVVPRTLTRRQLTSRPDHLRPELWIYFIDPEDKEFKETIKNARKKLETPMAPAMPCKTSRKSKHGETRSKTNVFKSKFACILEASESTRLRMEESLPNHHIEDHNSLQHCNLVQKFIPMPQAMKIPAAKAAMDK